MAGYPSGQQQGQQIDEGFVAKCSAQDCSYNKQMQCFAHGINVKVHSDEEGLHADCDTYTKNQHMEH